MKKLNLLLMMLASFTLIFASSCKDNDKDKEVTEITLSVSGGTEVTLDGTNITKDIIVTASEKATQDIVVSLTSNAAEGEATFASPTVTIKQGEKTAVGQITFAAAKFPAGTAQKKITVTIKTQTEHVTPDVPTTDFLVMGIGGPKLIPLTIAGSATELNTTAGEQTLTVTATLTEAATEEVSIAIAYDGTSDNLKELFKEIKTITIAKDQLTGTATFKVGKGVEGTLKLGFTTANDKVDLQTKTLAATFATDKNNLTIAANNTTFNTTDAEQTMTVTATLVEALTEELNIAITYEGSTENMEELFKAVTSIKIAADAKTTTMDFKVPKSTEGTLKMTFAIENEDVTLKTASLTGTFTYTKPVITPLCATSNDGATYAQLSGFTIGDKTIAIAKGEPAYQNKLAETTANITEGATVMIGVRNNDAKDPQDPYCHAWVDWNKDNQVTENELVGTAPRTKVAVGATNEKYLEFAFKAPENTPTGTYHMRVGTNFKTGKSGCTNEGADESRTTYDLTINYTAGGSVEPGEDPTFAVVNPTSGDIVVPATGDKEVTFKVQLSKEAEEEQTITLAATSTGSKSGIINPTSVIFAAGETSKDVKIKFLSADFTSDAVTATVTVTGTSQNLTATAASIAYNVKGTAAASSKQDLKYSLVSESGTGLIFTASDNTKVLKFYVRTEAETQNGAVTLKAAVTGTGVTGSDYTLTDAGTIVSPANDKFKRFEITVNKSAIGKTLVVSITSDDTTIDSETSSLSFPITLVTAPANPFDYKVDYTVGGSKNVEVTTGGWLQLAIATTGDVEPETTLLLTPSMTGGITIGGITGVVEMTSSSESIWINVSNFEDLANGTTGKLTFTSAYTTFAAGAGVTFTIKK